MTDLWYIQRYLEIVADVMMQPALATHAQSAWPHTDDRHLVNIQAILLTIVALDSPFQELHNNAIVCCITMVGHLVAHDVSLGVR